MVSAVFQPLSSWSGGTKAEVIWDRDERPRQPPPFGPGTVRYHYIVTAARAEIAAIPAQTQGAVKCRQYQGEDANAMYPFTVSPNFVRPSLWGLMMVVEPRKHERFDGKSANYLLGSLT